MPLYHSSKLQSQFHFQHKSRRDHMALDSLKCSRCNRSHTRSKCHIWQRETHPIVQTNIFTLKFKQQNKQHRYEPTMESLSIISHLCLISTELQQLSSINFYRLLSGMACNNNYSKSGAYLYYG